MSEYIEILDEKDLPLVFVVPQANYDTHMKSKQKYRAVKTKIETNTELKDVELSNVKKNIGDFSGGQDQFVESTEKEACEQGAQSQPKDQENLFRKYPELRNLKQAVVKIEKELMKGTLLNREKKENVTVTKPLQENASSTSSTTNETSGRISTATSSRHHISTSSDEQNRERNKRLRKN